MKLNKFFSVILCAALLSVSTGFASEGWKADIGNTASRIWNAMPTGSSYIPVWLKDFVTRNRNKVIGTLIGLGGLGTLIYDLQNYRVYLQECEKYDVEPETYWVWVASRASEKTSQIVENRLQAQEAKKFRKDLFRFLFTEAYNFEEVFGPQYYDQEIPIMSDCARVVVIGFVTFCEKFLIKLLEQYDSVSEIKSLIRTMDAENGGWVKNHDITDKHFIELLLSFCSVRRYKTLESFGEFLQKDESVEYRAQHPQEAEIIGNFYKQWKQKSKVYINGLKVLKQWLDGVIAQGFTARMGFLPN